MCGEIESNNEASTSSSCLDEKPGNLRSDSASPQQRFRNPTVAAHVTWLPHFAETGSALEPARHKLLQLLSDREAGNVNLQAYG